MNSNAPKMSQAVWPDFSTMEQHLLGRYTYTNLTTWHVQKEAIWLFSHYILRWRIGAVLKTFFFDISFSFYFFNHTEEQRERETGEEQQQHRPQRSELAFRDLRIYFRVLRLKYEIIFDPT